MRDERPVGGGVRVRVALFATYAGLIAFFAVHSHPAGRPTPLPLAVLAASVTAAGVFKVLEYLVWHLRAGVPALVDLPLPDTVEAGAPPVVPSAARGAPRRAGSTGALTAFLTITGVPAAIGGGICGLYFGTSRSAVFDQTVGSVIIGTLLGGALGALIGIPAAGFIWLTGRRRH